MQFATDQTAGLFILLVLTVILGCMVFGAWISDHLGNRFSSNQEDTDE
jgi:Tfp pilus assembly protein PilX